MEKGKVKVPKGMEKTFIAECTIPAMEAAAPFLQLAAKRQYTSLEEVEGVLKQWKKIAKEKRLCKDFEVIYLEANIIAFATGGMGGDLQVARVVEK